MKKNLQVKISVHIFLNAHIFVLNQKKIGKPEQTEKTEKKNNLQKSRNTSFYRLLERLTPKLGHWPTKVVLCVCRISAASSGQIGAPLPPRPLATPPPLNISV